MDRYKNFAELAASEKPNAFKIDANDRHTPVSIITPHGGAIEPGTSELARAVAGDVFSVYLFEGKKPNGNRDLHITSTNFDEPSGLSLVEGSEIAITMHGCQGDDEIVYVGGRHRSLVDKLTVTLRERGFAVDVHDDLMLQGTDRRNICNRGRSGMGVQFEVTRALRDRLANATGSNTVPTLSDFVDAIHEAVETITQ